MEKVKSYILLFLTFVVLILIILSIKDCSGLKEPLVPIKNDTTIIHHKDTIWTKDTIFSFKHIKIPVKQVDTVFKPIYIDTNDCKRVFVYKDSLVDSNLIIYYKDYIQGILRDKELSYKLKVPLKIYDSVIETIKIHPKFVLYGTLGIGQGIIAPGGEVALKRFKIGLGYNFQTRSYMGTLSYKLFEK